MFRSDITIPCIIEIEEQLFGLRVRIVWVMDCFEVGNWLSKIHKISHDRRWWYWNLGLRILIRKCYFCWRKNHFFWRLVTFLCSNVIERHLGPILVDFGDRWLSAVKNGLVFDIWNVHSRIILTGKMWIFVSFIYSDG